MPGNEKETRPKAKDLMKKLTQDYYQGARHAHEMGKLIGYTTAVSPVEIFYAHDVIPIYPENHAVMCITNRMAAKLSMAVERLGYTSHLCAYARSDLGYRELKESPIGGIPDPDLLVACNAQCFTLTKWFEVLSRRYQLPVFVFDTPHYIRKAEARKNILAYVEKQLYEMIEARREDEKIFNMDRLREVMPYSNEACRGYKAFLDRGFPQTFSHFDLRYAHPHGHQCLSAGTPEAARLLPQGPGGGIPGEKVSRGSVR